MFSILDGINSWLSYISIEAKTKARIYTILGFFGWLYMIYITYRFLTNQVYMRGLLMLGATIVLGYFLYLNIIYYFTRKSSKLDVTPIINKTLHIQPKEAVKPGSRYRDIPANGLFDERQTMPAKLATDTTEQAAINDLAVQMIQEKLVADDYAGLDDHQIKVALKENAKPVYAIGEGAMIPYFSMKKINDQYVVYAGINEPHAKAVGHIQTVGLQSVQQIDLSKIKLYLAAAYLTGGKCKMMGRSGIIETDDNYHVEVQVAYTKK
ncbi:DUF6681 family protein [Fructilactobacillus frigidiflavus]|uniref:DUF6681 family protein n=1 Tax=Fructilactobacillus frigidiflavus TaxID=3242688 RepID=UPI0037583E15